MVLGRNVEQDQSASVAQLYVHPTGDQEVVGSTPAEVGTILSWIDHEIFSMVILSLFADSRGAVVSSWQRMCTILVNCLED